MPEVGVDVRLGRSYARILARARRLSRDEAEAADLVQDALVAALEAGRQPLDRDEDLPWMFGVLKNLAALRGRTESRRRHRERDWTGHDSELAETGEEPGPRRAELAQRLGALPPAARRVASLALHGLDGKEIRWILELTDGAFRQRLTTIRKHLRSWPEDLRAEAMAASLRRPADSSLELGLIRRALVRGLRRMPGIGSHDPDGHLLVFRQGTAHKTAGVGNLSVQVDPNTDQEQPE